MTDLNKVILIGRLTKDVELKYTQGGTPVANFSLASNYSYSKSEEKKETVSFFNCVAWGKLGEVIAQYCQKGNRIAIDGRLQQRSWEDKDGNKKYSIEIVVEKFQFLTPKNTASNNISDVQPVEDVPEIFPFPDDDIPF